MSAYDVTHDGANWFALGVFERAERVRIHRQCGMPWHKIAARYDVSVETVKSAESRRDKRVHNSAIAGNDLWAGEFALVVVGKMSDRDIWRLSRMLLP